MDIQKIKEEEDSSITKEEYTQWVMKTLSIEQLTLVNTNIFYNPKHIDFYVAYKLEEFETCKKYLLDNIEELKIGKTPKKFKSAAKRSLKMVKAVQ